MKNEVIVRCDNLVKIFELDEQKVLAETIQKIADNIELLLNNNEQTFMNRLVG